MGDWPYRGQEEDRERRDQALNEVIKYAAEELAPGWEIVLGITGGADADGDPGNGEVTIGLFDPEGNEVTADWDGERRNVWDMVDHSRNPNAGVGE